MSAISRLWLSTSRVYKQTRIYLYTSDKLTALWWVSKESITTTWTVFTVDECVCMWQRITQSGFLFVLARRCSGQCKECKNFNSMFNIISGLGYGATSRLKQSWEKLPSKYQRLFRDMQDLMDPSRNMSKYRNLLNSEHVQPPMVSSPFFFWAYWIFLIIHTSDIALTWCLACFA